MEPGIGRAAHLRQRAADLDAAAVMAERLGQYEFQFVMGPLVLRRGTASPVNPLAIF